MVLHIGNIPFDSERTVTISSSHDLHATKGKYFVFILCFVKKNTYNASVQSSDFTACILIKHFVLLHDVFSKMLISKSHIFHISAFFLKNTPFVSK